MKKLFCLALIVFAFFNTKIYSQITTNSSIPLEQLILDNLAEGCVEITNITTKVNGTSSSLESFGYFEKAGSNFPFENGIVLSTGNVNSAGNTVNTNILAEGDDNWGTDPDLEAALGITNTLNATSIEFDFVSFSNQISFNYILASEEYYEDNPCRYSDGFAFLIKQEGTTDAFENIALIPGTGTPVNTSTIHDNMVGYNCPATNVEFYEGTNLGDTNFNGRTKVLTANASIQPNVKYHIKLVIADQTDYKFDSAVFIEGNSFNASVDLGQDLSTCASSVDLNGDISNNLASYDWYLNDIIIDGANDPTYTATESGIYKVLITLQVSDSFCTIEDEIEITLNGEQSSGDLSNFILCDDSSNDGVETFDLESKYYEIFYSVPYGNYNISYHLSDEDAKNNTSGISAPYQNTSSPETIYVRIENTDNGCLAYSTFDLIVNPSPEINEPDPIVVCDDQESDGFTFIDLTQADSQITASNPNLYVSYHYSQQDADSGYYPIYSPYTNTNSTDTLFVRVYDPSTGCHTTTTIDVTVSPNPVINDKNNYINFCKIDDDGFESFDLTSIIPNVLNGITNVTSTFHLTEAEALEGINPITNDTNYTNIEPYYQVVYIRVMDDDTGCFSVTPISLHINLVEYSIDYENYIVCDDFSNDGQEYFNLLYVEEDIAREYGDLDFVFYESQEDLDNQTNPIGKDIPYLVTSSPKTLYVNVADGECIVDFLVNLVINPPLILSDVTDVYYCDTDLDGYTSVLLETFNSELTEGVSPSSIQYYLTEIDALNDENRLPPTMYNSSNPQEIFIRVTNPQSGCVAVKPINLNIITAPEVGYPQNIIVCDDDQDAFSIVDLTQTIPEIASDITDLEISFHQDYWNAIDDTFPIDTPEAFNATNQYIYVRVKNTQTDCYNISYFYVNINTLPVFPDISTFENCESDSNDIADFYFYLKDSEILNGQYGKQVLYFETAQDAIDRTNPIDKYNPYSNISNPQTFHVRVESFSDPNCFGTSQFELEVGSIPLFNQPENITVCDDISNDNIESFDLSYKIDEITNGIDDNLTVTLHTNAYDAEYGYNPIDVNFTNYVNPQQIYARITNGTYCHGITDFLINIVSVPNVKEPSPVVVCDTDYDGFTTIDVTITELEILDLRQDNLVITYHSTQDGVYNDTDIIANPENYNNISNPEIVYIKVNNTVSNCFVSFPIVLQIDLPPAINEFETYEICDNPTQYFDLNEINSVIVDNDPDAVITYYTSDLDAESASNAISTDYTYATTNDTIYIRIESAERGCHYVYPFQLIVNPLPIANQPNNMEACDDVSADGFEIFDFTLQNSTVLGSQDANDFTITYHETDLNAQNDEAALNTSYNAENGQTIYVRIENNTTGCFSTTQFTTIVHEYPNQVPAIVLCDVDYDETIVLDISANETSLFSMPSANISISYFDDLALIDDDASAISDPVNYSNLTNPQKIYMKVYNISANCYNIIEQDIIINSPPAINEFGTYEICDNSTQYFDLNEINSVIVDNDPDAIITYYSSDLDAESANSSISTDYTYTTTNDTIYIRIESADRGCHYVYPFQLIVNPLPIANQPNNMAACDDDYDFILNFNLTDQNNQILGGQNANNFTITYFSSLEDANSNINNLENTHQVDTTQEIFARVENNITGCFSTTSFAVEVMRKPTNNIEDQVICLENFPLYVDASTGFSTDSYLWLPNGETTPDIEISEIGSYSLTITSDFGCSTTKTFTVIESEQATIEFEETVDFSDPNNITITVSGIGDYLYQLDDGEPQRSNFFTYVPIGMRTITVIDLNGCTSTTKEVMIFDVPKFFTPNNDGDFDTWHITGVDQLEGTMVYIYNRYGKLMKTLPHTSLGWDGTYNGANMPSDDYWYVANIFYKNENFEMKGHFTLKR